MPDLVPILILSGNSLARDKLAGAFEQVFGQGATQVTILTSARDGLGAIRTQTFSLIVVDYLLEDGKSAQFIRGFYSMAPNSSILFLLDGPYSSEDGVARLLRDYPHLNYAAYPYDFERLAMRAHQLLRPGIKLELTYFGLRMSELIQAFSLSRQSVTITVITASARIGSIFLRHGDLIHASYAGREGVEALMLLLQQRNGEVRVQKSCLTTRQTIHRPTQQTLLDICRIMDETLPGSVVGPARSNQPSINEILSELDDLFLSESQKLKLSRTGESEPNSSPGDSSPGNVSQPPSWPSRPPSGAFRPEFEPGLAGASASLKPKPTSMADLPTQAGKSPPPPFLLNEKHEPAWALEAKASAAVPQASILQRPSLNESPPPGAPGAKSSQGRPAPPNPLNPPVSPPPRPPGASPQGQPTRSAGSASAKELLRDLLMD